MAITEVRRALRQVADPARAAVSERFFKTGPGEYAEGDRFLGVVVPDARKVAARSGELGSADLRLLLRSPWHEERLLALLILVRQYARADERKRESIFRLYVAQRRYVNNWDLVDSSAPYIVGPRLLRGAATAAATRAWLLQCARSPSLWDRRIAMLATFDGVRHGQMSDALRIARILLRDEHDLIHKAVGWMLREIGQRDVDRERRFLDQHAARMPRTMLRYAIEHFPQRLRQAYMGLAAAAKR
jgi:3-methyladenine DNA glycosylase AlkD